MIFKKIFAEIVKINTLDYKTVYERIQQTIIETLDTCQVGRNKGKILRDNGRFDHSSASTGTCQETETF